MSQQRTSSQLGGETQKYSEEGVYLKGSQRRRMDEANRAWQEHGTCAGCHSDQHSHFDCPTSPLCSRCGHPHRRQDCTVRPWGIRPGKAKRQEKRKAEEDAEMERKEKRIALLERENAAREKQLELYRQIAQLERLRSTPFAPSTPRPSLGQQTHRPPPFPPSRSFKSRVPSPVAKRSSYPTKAEEQAVTVKAEPLDDP